MAKEDEMALSFLPKPGYRTRQGQRMPPSVVHVLKARLGAVAAEAQRGPGVPVLVHEATKDEH